MVKLTLVFNQNAKVLLFFDMCKYFFHFVEFII